MVNQFLKDQLNELDTPLSPKIGWLMKKKLRIIIINEDMSFKEFFANYPNSYVIDLVHRSYIIVPSAIIRGKYSTLIYFFNNPFPIKFEFEFSKLTAYDLRTDDQTLDLEDSQKTILQNTFMDAETLNLAFNTRVMRGLYAYSGITAKHIIIILVVITVIILIFLQVFGVVDIWSLISGGKAGG